MRENKFLNLHHLSLQRKRYDTCVQDCMRAIITYLFALEKEDARCNRHIYVVTFPCEFTESRNRIAIMCSITPLDTNALDVMITQYMDMVHYPEVTMFIYDFKNDELNQILNGDIYSWLKKEFPHSRFVLSKEYLPGIQKDVNVYHFVLSK